MCPVKLRPGLHAECLLPLEGCGTSGTEKWSRLSHNLPSLPASLWLASPATGIKQHTAHQTQGRTSRYRLTMSMLQLDPLAVLDLMPAAVKAH